MPTTVEIGPLEAPLQVQEELALIDGYAQNLTELEQLLGVNPTYREWLGFAGSSGNGVQVMVWQLDVVGLCR